MKKIWSTKKPFALMMTFGAMFAFAACTAPAGNMNGDDGKGGDGGNRGGDGGSSGGDGGDNGGDGGNDGGDGGSSGGGEGGIVMAPETANVCGPIAPSPVRRLNRWEWGASIRELFPHVFNAGDDGVWHYDDHRAVFQRPGATPDAMGEKPETKIHFIAAALSDPNTFGFENRASNLNPTPGKLEDISDLSVLAAEIVTLDANIDKSLSCTDATVACGKKNIDALAPKFYRRPLTDEERTRLYDFFEAEFKAAEAEGGDIEPFLAATRLTLEALMQSPGFLYRLEFGDESTAKDGAVRLTDYEIASRMAYLFWHAGPDAELLAAAEAGKLVEEGERRKQAERLIAHDNFRFTSVEFFRQWADFEKIFDAGYRRYPGRQLNQDPHSVQRGVLLGARQEVQQLAEYVMNDADASVNTLYTTRVGHVNEALKHLYVQKAPPPLEDRDVDMAFEEITVPEERTGFLTRAFFPWAYSHWETPDPPLRGSFIYSKVFCNEPLTPPPSALEEAIRLEGSSGFPKNDTNRKQFEYRIEPNGEPTVCSGCHDAFDPFGFVFENYGDFGQYITTDRGKQIDASATVALGDETIDGEYKNAVEFTKALGGSDTARKCMVSQWYEYAVGRQSLGNYASGEKANDKRLDLCRIEAMDKAVAENGGDLRAGLVQFVASDDFVWRRAY